MAYEDTLMVMPANNASATVMGWAAKYPGKIGWLLGPSSIAKTKLRSIPFALDNDAYAAFSNNTAWDESKWLQMLDSIKASGRSPLWVLVPDVVADKAATLARWRRYAPVAAAYGWPLAFAVQDGMTPADIPDHADVLFIGGTTAWKWQSLPVWSKTGRHIHVGRVNEVRRLFTCQRLKVKSVDGTGWFRGTAFGRQAVALGQWLAGTLTPHPELSLAAA